MDNRLEIRSSRLKNLIFSLLSIFMTSLAVFMLLSGLYEDNILYAIDLIFIGLIGTLFFGAAILIYIRNIFIIRPVLILENDGFYENTTILSMKNSLISWDEVKKIKNMP